jgi:cation:H+ antiporter
MLSALGWCLAGLVLLIAGAELLVRDGTQLAARLGVSPTVIGLTIVALGTSAPELAVGIDAVLVGNGDLAVGNIAGTNVVNILLILGMSALISPLVLDRETKQVDLPAIVLASAALLLMAVDGSLSRAEGLVLLAGSLLYTAAIMQRARQQSRDIQAAFPEEFADDVRQAGATRLMFANLAGLLASILIIVVAAHWLVKGAVDLAKLWGVSDEFIGLTVIAIGTSAPELVTTIVSTLKKQRDIAIGNLLGSSVYNILFILGVTVVIPSSPVPVAFIITAVDIPVMTAVALVCVPVFCTGRGVSRPEGALFVGTYFAYLSYLVMRV